MALSEKEVLEQSKSAFNQWKDVWEKHAKVNGEIARREATSNQDILFVGAGRTLLCIAYAPSFEKNIETLKKYHNEGVDIACVDKCFKALVENGITPNYVFLADAKISYKEWLEPVIDKTEDCILISNVTANIEWTQNWKGLQFFYVNKDNIETEKIYTKLSGVNEIIPASSNVGNSVLVYATQILGYEKYLLLGYDYSWKDDDNYYAFNDSQKRYWMKHAQVIDVNGDMVNTSQNLIFSARWLTDFHNKILTHHKIKMLNCSGQGILQIPRGNLEKELQNAVVRELTEQEKNHIFNARVKEITINKSGGVEALKEVLSKLKTLEVKVKYIPDEVIQWLNVNI